MSLNRIMIIGAAGFIGTNLAIKLCNSGYNVTLVDIKREYFGVIERLKLPVKIVEYDFNAKKKFDDILKNQDIIYHLVSTTFPSVTNQQIPKELTNNVVMSALLLESCVRCNVKRIIFMSSGGTVYGTEVCCPISESAATNPISSYGIQKLTIEKLLYLYNYLYGLDYRIIRLANPYGNYQRPNGKLGAVTTFVYNAITRKPITLYGNGSVVRDFVYIDDAVKAIINISFGEKGHVYNVGSGQGVSIINLLTDIREVLNIPITIEKKSSRKVDVPVNYLDIHKYETDYGKLVNTSLKEGILKTAEFLSSFYGTRS